MKKSLLLFVLSLCGLLASAAEQFVNFNGNGLLLNQSSPVGIYVAPDAPRGVMRAAKDLCADIGRVTGKDAQIVNDTKQATIVIYTQETGKWEEYQIRNEESASRTRITITGSDRRGTIYGIYELSKQIGVSPWYWWADVPVAHHDRIYVKPGTYTDGEPKVKYRGIFINDESPSFTGWANKKFGGLNAQMYTHMFELILRLKANYLWPAMWGNAFNEDDPQNPVKADEYGVIMGTSHHEPMMRAYNEYRRRRKDIGAWNYATNKDNVNKFFREGMANAKDRDNIVTIGMRGDGDEAMAGSTDDDNISTLKDVIANQRQIIVAVTGKKASEVPQLWAIFTEVQRYYDRGMTVPDDVIKVFCDNNWGYIRRTGPEKERNADGTYKPMGLYYHIDMNGGPWNDRWINTTTIPKLQNQLGLAYQTGLDDLWIINVGDLKPKEVPIDFIMRYAWNPEAITINDCHQYMVDFCTENFGADHAEAIAQLIETYSNLNLQRKPESQSTAVYSPNNYHEADRMIARWERLALDADSLKKLIPQAQQDAFFQLAYYPAVASAQTALVYLYATMGQNYYRQGNVGQNHHYAQMEKDAYARDKALQAYYNDTLAQGKWKNMMQDIHFGYSQWFMPDKDSIPEVRLLSPIKDATRLGVAVEGYEPSETLKLPKFDVLDNQTYYIDVFNRGVGSVNYKAKASHGWIVIDKPAGTVAMSDQIHVSIDWSRLAEGEHTGYVTISWKDQKYDIAVTAIKKPIPESAEPYYGSMSGQEFSFPAKDYADGRDVTFLPGLGRDEGVISLNSKRSTLNYQVYFPTTGKQTILVGILPTQDIKPERGLHFSIAFDNKAPKQIDARKGLVDTFSEYTPQALAKSNVLKPVERANRNIKMVVGNWYCRNEVHDNIRWIDVELSVDQPGLHRLKITDADPEIMFERFVINPDNDHYSYFGAPTIAHPSTPQLQNYLSDYLNPQDEQRAVMIWQWMDGLVTREAITRDLEAFKAAGLSGVQNFQIGGPDQIRVGNPACAIGNERWKEMMRWSMEECQRLGLSFGTHNCPGWSSSAYPSVTPEYSMQKLVFTETTIEKGSKTKTLQLPKPKTDPKYDYYEDVAVIIMPKDSVVKASDIIVLQDVLDADGTLRLPKEIVKKVKQRSMTVMRFGHTTNGKTNEAQAPETGRGLECDKLRREAVKHFWDGYPQMLIDLAGPLAGTTFCRLEIDSYEAGGQDWSVVLPEEFKRRKGYDLLPYLPQIMGRVVIDGKEPQSLFRRDLTDVITSLVAENYYGYMNELCAQTPGLQLLIEPYGTGSQRPFQMLDIYKIMREAPSALMATEFWVKPETWGWRDMGRHAEATRRLGRSLLWAEAFTCWPLYAWQDDPQSLKPICDRAFATGVNRMMLHAGAVNPWPQAEPGMSFGIWGTQFVPTQTWWRAGGAKVLFDYMARCQSLLQRGVPTPEPWPMPKAFKSCQRTDKDCDIVFLCNPTAESVTETLSLNDHLRGRQVEIWNPYNLERANLSSVVEDMQSPTLTIEPYGSRFLIVHPADNHVVSTDKEASQLSLLKTAQPASTTAITTLDGPWEITFPNVTTIKTDTLMDWSQSDKAAIKYFSGTATYRTTFSLKKKELKAGQRFILDLGQVKNMACVRINGQAFPAMWKAPWLLDVTQALRVGENVLEVEVTNLWVNRMIGDEQEPDDIQWSEPLTYSFAPGSPTAGRYMAAIPAWLNDGTPRPSQGRKTVGCFKFFTSESPLQPSGLLRQVRLLVSK